MNLINKNILLISPEPWEHIFVSKHHYSTHLAKRSNRVFFLNPPTGNNSLRETNYKNVVSVDYLGFPKGLRFYPEFLQKFFIRRMFNHLQDLCKVNFDIVWSFDNSVFFDFSALPRDVLKISHIVDLNQNFQTEKASRTADYCFCTTEIIKSRLKKFNSRVFKINHGFNAMNVASHSVSLPGKSKVKAVYSGNLAIPFVDWYLIQDVVQGNPGIDFVFVGPNKEALVDDVQGGKAKLDILKLPNCIFVGTVASKDLLSYLIAADILLVVYQERYQADQAANPHKMMEYLASGKMIVATNTDEYKGLADNHLFLMSKHNCNFPFLFKKAMSEIGHWNSEGKQEARKAFARDNTYDRQINRIEEILKLNEKSY